MITQSELKRLFDYNPRTGVFTRKVSRRRYKAGEVAGNIGSTGYLRIQINDKKYDVHRLAFLYMTGHFPTEHTDHINRVKTDNKWCNLREATRSQNMKNSAVQKGNKLGIKGVIKVGSKYIAQGALNCKRLHIGSFNTKKEASEAYEQFARKNHKEFYYGIN